MESFCGLGDLPALAPTECFRGTGGQFECCSQRGHRTRVSHGRTMERSGGTPCEVGAPGGRRRSGTAEHLGLCAVAAGWRDSVPRADGGGTRTDAGRAVDGAGCTHRGPTHVAHAAPLLGAADGLAGSGEVAQATNGGRVTGRRAAVVAARPCGRQGAVGAGGKRLAGDGTWCNGVSVAALPQPGCPVCGLGRPVDDEGWAAPS
mmetsp:Transcript_15693/g.50012  ORF Transcript_15693/g.50012 Transcript_15693/m.50012 type:complete len:204 (-) Transcript_15693:85-696(-)